MDTEEPLKRPDVLIVSSDAGDYLPLLEELTQSGTEISISTNADGALAAWRGQPVVLGQPDLVARVLEKMPEVRWVQSTWAGVTPLLELDRSDYQLTGIKDTFGPQMGEYVMAYLLAHELKLFERLEHQERRNWWEEASGSLQGRTLGIMGAGSIGRHIAQMAAPFGMRLLGFSRGGAPQEEFEKLFPADSLECFLEELDYLVCVLPDTPGTLHLLGEAAFRTMKNDCYLINIGRGNLIDEAALVNALRAGELAGAVLDVFQQEPLPVDSPLWDAPGLIVTGHVAAKSWPEDITGIFRENYRRFVEGETLKYRVDFERGY